MVECPRCRLTNPDGAAVCDCGYNFQTRTVTDPDRRGSQYRGQGTEQVEEQSSGMPGWVWFVLIYLVGNGILYQTTGIFLIPIPRK